MSITPGAPTFDRLAPYPELAAVRDAAVVGDWAGVAAAYGKLESWDLRTAAVSVVGETADAERFLVPAAEPEDAVLARTALAARYIEVGWEVRTSARASEVSREQFAVFHEHLRRAERLLIDVTARDPGNLAAWTQRLVTVRGLELGQSEARRRWRQIARHDPHHFVGQVQLLQQLCPKWGGKLEQMHEFARDCAAAAPPGALSPVLVVQAHLEHWVTLDGREGLAYLRSAAVRDSVDQAAARSVLNPAFRRPYGWVMAHSYFALYHSIVGDHRSAAVHFRAIAPFEVVQPWLYYYADGEQMFRRHRAAALGKDH
ncbi:MAG: hypothetical protein FWJ93_04240 [Micromonosporaceae bacterium]